MSIHPDKQRQLVKKLFNNSPVRLIPAHVVSDEGLTCTVRPVGSELVLSGINHYGLATASMGMHVLPEIESLVFVADPSGSRQPASMMIAVITKPRQFGLHAGGVAASAESAIMQLATPTGELTLTPDVLTRLPFESIEK